MNLRDLEHDDMAIGDTGAGRRWLVLITSLLLVAGVGLATLAGLRRGCHPRCPRWSKSAKS